MPSRPSAPTAFPRVVGADSRARLLRSTTVESGPLVPLIERLSAAHAERSPLVVGLAGSVAVGKSTLAAALAEALAPRAVAVVGTDGFLLPNAVLIERDLFLRKGFPESYDAEALTAFIERVRTGTAVEVPVYSHAEYDVVDERRPIGTPEVCIVEGVNALRFAEHLDLAIYLHADEAHIVDWYADRFVAECAAARDDETSFYRGWSGLEEGEQRALAAQFWAAINHPNLVDHIAPTARAAHVVVEKGPDHGILRIEWRR